METFLRVMELVFDFMSTPFTLWGFHLSFYTVVFFILVFGLVCKIIRMFY